MCTVTYIPISETDYIFTSNRDEFPQRTAKEIVTDLRFEKTIVYPKDTKANGTWIAISDANQLVCILNGAFTKHKHQPPYRLSRGLMAIEFFSYSSVETFVSKFNFQGIEPFTLVIFDNGHLHEVRWDETKVFHLPLDTSSQHLWASCTLYNSELQLKRRKWFAGWNSKTEIIDQDAVLDFHKNGGEGNPESDVVMNYKNKVMTTSITSVVKKSDHYAMKFEDLQDHRIISQELVLANSKTYQ